MFFFLNPLNAEFNPIRQLLVLLGAHPVLHVSRIRVNLILNLMNLTYCIIPLEDNTNCCTYFYSVEVRLLKKGFQDFKTVMEILRRQQGCVFY